MGCNIASREVSPADLLYDRFCVLAFQWRHAVNSLPHLGAQLEFDLTAPKLLFCSSHVELSSGENTHKKILTSMSTRIGSSLVPAAQRT